MSTGGRLYLPVVCYQRDASQIRKHQISAHRRRTGFCSVPGSRRARKSLLSACSAGDFPLEESQFSKSLIRTLCSTSGSLTDSPVQMLMRFAQHDTEVGGTRVESGAIVAVMLGAANRDPAQFPEPERFDVARRLNDHLAFRRGHPLLSRRATGAAGGAHRVRGNRRTIRDYGARQSITTTFGPRIVRHPRSARVAADRRLVLVVAFVRTPVR